MKWTLTLTMVLQTAFGYGQNYQPINSNSLQVFYQTPSFPLNTWGDSEGGNMWGTRIDSVSLSLNGDSLYHNYRIFRDTAAEMGNSECVWGNAPNWNGLYSRLEPLGAMWFYNQSGDSIKLDYAGSLNSDWLTYTYENGDSLVAKVIDVQWVEDEWISDSVKTIAFTRYSNGISTNDITNDVRLELYKSAGFRKTVDFAKFPFDSIPIHRADLNSINMYSRIYSTSLGMPPTVGDGFYRVTRTQHYNYGTLSSQSQSLVSERITEVTPLGLNGQFSATVIRNTSSGSQVLNVVYDLVLDTFVTLVQKYEGGNLMPRQEGSIYHYSIAPLVGGSDNCLYPVVSINYNGGYSTSPCISFETNECWGGEERFAPYIGLIERYSYIDDGWCSGSGDIYSSYYRYLKVGDLECGDYAMVGIEELQEVVFTLYPNPATHSFRIQLSDSSSPTPEGILVSVTDVLGRTIANLEPQTLNLELNVSDWPNGIYFVSVTDRNGGSYSERLMVQH